MVFIWRHYKLMKKLSVILSVLFALSISAFPPSIHGIIASSISQGPSYDADAKKFIDSSGITDTIQKRAINTLVVQLKDSSLWSTMICIYPLVGGTASTTKWNLKDPRDLDAAYRITWAGGWTFDTTGATANAINTSGDTHFKPTNWAFKDSVAFGGYVANNTNADYAIMGVTNSSSQGFSLLPRSANMYAYTNTGYTFQGSGLVMTTAVGFSVATGLRRAVRMYKNNNLVITTTSAADAVTLNINMKIGCSNVNGTDTYKSNYKIGFVFISNYLTAAQVSTLTNIFNQFKAKLNR